MEKAPFILSEADNLWAVRESLKRSSRVKVRMN